MSGNIKTHQTSRIGISRKKLLKICLRIAVLLGAAYGMSLVFNSANPNGIPLW